MITPMRATSDRDTAIIRLEGPTAKSDNGIYTGNGFAGAVLWGDARSWRISLDRSDVWDLRQPHKPWETATFGKLCRALDRKDMDRVHEIVMKFSTHPAGAPPTPTNLNLGRCELHFDPVGDDARVADRLDMRDGTLTRTVREGAASLRGRAWVDPAQPLIFLELHAQGRIFTARAKVLRSRPKTSTEKGLRHPAPKTGRASDATWWALQLHEGNAYALVLRQLDAPLNGPAWNKGLKVTPSRATRCCLVIEHAATVDEAIARGLARARAASWKNSSDANRRWWGAFWKKSDVRLSDTGMERAWRTGLYHLACSSRPGSPPVTLQGPWSPDAGSWEWSAAPWLGLVFNNLNTQMSYWPAAAANHLELIEPFLDFFLDPERMRVMEEETRDYFKMPGIAVPVGADLLGRRVHSWMVVQSWPMVGAWICTHLWEYYRYTNDLAFLRDRAYPYFKQNLEFLEAFCRRDAKGRVLIWPSHSPELFDDNRRIWTKNPTIDLWLLKTLLGSAMEASRILGVDASSWAHWKTWRARVPDYEAARKRGYLTESDEMDTELSHRHFSCCAPIHPGCEIHIEGKDRDLAINSVRRIIRRGSGGWVGFSHVWLACLAARVGLANMAAWHLRLYWNHYTAPNGFHLNMEMHDLGVSNFAHDYYTSQPMSIESGIGAASAVNEMLLQSWGGVIRVFPSLAADVDARFENLLAEGGVKVGAERRGGIVRRIVLTPARDGKLRLRLPAGWKRLTLNRPVGVRYRKAPHGITAEWEAKAGTTYRVA